jgi:hypothetical protein
MVGGMQLGSFYKQDAAKGMLQAKSRCTVVENTSQGMFCVFHVPYQTSKMYITILFTERRAPDKRHCSIWLKAELYSAILTDMLQDITVSACASGRGQLIIGDTEGTLYFINRHLELTSFKAYELSVSHLFQLKQHNVLVTVGVSKQCHKFMS